MSKKRKNLGIIIILIGVGLFASCVLLSTHNIKLSLFQNINHGKIYIVKPHYIDSYVDREKLKYIKGHYSSVFIYTRYATAVSIIIILMGVGVLLVREAEF